MGLIYCALEKHSNAHRLRYFTQAVASSTTRFPTFETPRSLLRGVFNYPGGGLLYLDNHKDGVVVESIKKAFQTLLVLRLAPG